MNGLLRKAAFSALAGVVGTWAPARISEAGPSAANSDQPIPRVIGLGARSDLGPDPTGTIRYTIRDDSSPPAPLPGIAVSLDFSACDDVRSVCGNQVWMTDNAGKVTIVIAGSSTGGAGAGIETGPCVTVTVGGIPFDPLIAATADYDDLNGVNAIDKGIFLSDLYATSYYARSDFDDNCAGMPGMNCVDGIDQGIWQAFLYSGFSLLSCGN